MGMQGPVCVALCTGASECPKSIHFMEISEENREWVLKRVHSGLQDLWDKPGELWAMEIAQDWLEPLHGALTGF